MELRRINFTKIKKDRTHGLVNPSLELMDGTPLYVM